MFKNLSHILFLFMLMIGSIISISSNSWMGVWMGLEINLLSFIPMMTSKNNLNNSEAALNYFLIQAFASTIILFSIIIFMLLMNVDFFYQNMTNKLMSTFMISMTLMLKLGAAPFHFWFPNVMESLNWLNGLILMTWQKLSPMMILSYINLSKILLIFIILSAFMGAIGGLNQTSLRKLMAFSSINHISWMIMAFMFNENLWMVYFLMYTFLNASIMFIFNSYQIFYLNQMYSLFINSYFLKLSLLTTLLSLGGLPPFLGFLPKWLVIQALMFMNMNLLNLFMIFMSLIILYYYLKISFAAFMLNYNNFNWNYKNFFNNNCFSYILNINFCALFGFFLLINLTHMIN